MAGSVPGKIIDKGKLADEKSNNKDISLLCDPCEEDGNCKVAVGFCVNCQHYLCDNCFQCHRIPKPMKEHRLMNEDEMPKKKVNCVFSEVCKMHEGKAVKYYCLEHETIGCNTCILIDHNPCREIGALADVAKDVEHSQLYRDFDEWRSQTEDIIRVQLGLTDENVTTAKTYSVAVLESIDNLQKEINERFHILRIKIVQEANEIADRDAKKLNNLKAYLTDAQEKVDDMKHDIEMLKTTNQSKHLFIAMKKAVQKQKILDKTLEYVKDKNKIQKYEFVGNGHLTNIMANIDDIGEIFFHDDIINTPISAVDYPMFVDYPEYGIPKCVPVSRNSFVMADHIRYCLCLVKDGKLVWEHKLSSGPWDIKSFENRKVAITLPYQGV